MSPAILAESLWQYLIYKTNYNKNTWAHCKCLNEEDTGCINVKRKKETGKNIILTGKRCILVKYKIQQFNCLLGIWT